MLQSYRRILSLLSLTAAAWVPIMLWADVDGADPRLTGAPGDNAAACTACHTGTALNGGGGSVKILLPAGNTYTPGLKQHVTVQVSDPAQRRWGFELTARLATDPASGQAGDLASTDGNTRVICNNGRAKPCTSSNAVQFITHTLTGTRPGTIGGANFEFDWTPPSTDAGKITLYAAGNAANGNNQNTGDHIYTASVELTPAASSPRPAISSERGVVNAASFQPGITQNSWITITGSNFSTTSRAWAPGDITSGKLPTSLDGVSVTVNNKPAYVEYISPTQINALAPADDSAGPVEVKVTVNGQTSASVTANLQSFSPAFFTFNGRYLAATHADNTFLGKTGLFASAPDITTPAKPGETIVLYGTGFGPTDPSIPAGQMADRLASVVTPLTITIGGIPANVSFGGLIPNFAGLYQFNVQVPSSAGDGDQPVTLQIGGVSSPNSKSCCYITVQK